MSFLRGRRFLKPRLEPLNLHTAKKWDVDTELERRQEVARRILVEEKRNVDRPKLIQEQPDFGDFHGPIG